VPQSQTRYPKRTKKAKEAEVSLEAHGSVVSSDDVSDSFSPSFLFSFPFADIFFSFSL
jgi:hypothetical protein